MTVQSASNTAAMPPIVDRDTWLAARKALWAEEKDLTHARDALNAKRRRLPMVLIDKPYRFEGPDGECTLSDLFEGRRLLYVHHFMWIDERDGPCLGCTAAADMNFGELILAHLKERDITFVAIARTPYAKLAALKRSNGWSFPFYSSFGADFNHDFHVTLDASKGSVEYNYLSGDALAATGITVEDAPEDMPGNSVFLRDGDKIYHTYSAYARGLDALFTPYNFIDLTPYGRQEAWEDSPEGWPNRDVYGPDVASE